MRGRALAIALVGGLGWGCAYRQTHLGTLDRSDQRRFSACRDAVERRLCGDDPDCPSWAPRMYIAQDPAARRQWLLDYGCPEERLVRAEKGVAAPRGGGK